MSKNDFTFVISLSVLNHLGRNLYRSFATVLGEAISNAWDADAANVWIEIPASGNDFLIKDDGVGMNATDFQDKFLKIGYSKRKAGARSPRRARPFIGRKGIGKLALLSCAETITVISKNKGGDYVGGVIRNPDLDKAITDDLNPTEYALDQWDRQKLKKYTEQHLHGTIIRFERVKDGIRNSFEHLQKIIALYFRFSLLDRSFNIFLNGEKITHKHLGDLAQKTEFLWKIGDLDDPYLTSVQKRFSMNKNYHEEKSIEISGISGFIASVEKPRDLKITATDERVGVDLFVNGRLRETDILKHIPTARVAESYLYGQVHFNELDDATDRFTSSREGIVADDPKYKAFLERFRKTILDVVTDWDKWRIKHRKEGDPENPRITRKERASQSLYGAVSDEFELPQGNRNRDKIDQWVEALGGDATFNFESYAECFISENLIRKFVKEKKMALTPEAKEEAAKWKNVERDSKNRANISIDIRRERSELNYMSMDGLANMVDKPADRIKQAGLARDAAEYKPMRDAVAHTALLTTQSKRRLTTVHENIKGRVKTLLAGRD